MLEEGVSFFIVSTAALPASLLNLVATAVNIVAKPVNTVTIIEITTSTSTMPKAQRSQESPSIRSRSWMLTIPHPKEDDVKDHPDIIFCAYQIERGAPSEADPQGHRHMHVFVVFENARMLNAVKKFFAYLGEPHCDACDMNAYFYVTKKPGQEGDWQEKDFSIEQESKEFGRIPQGIKRKLDSMNKSPSDTKDKQTKSDTIATKLMSKEWSEDDVREQEPGWYLLNAKKLGEFINNLRKEEIKHAIWKPWIVWLHGPTGTGKTCSVFDFESMFFGNKPDEVTVSGKGDSFINGYRGNDAVLIDETRGEIPYKDLLKMLDWNRGGKTVNIKFVSDGIWAPKRIYITSCYSPEDIYYRLMTEDDRIEQLIRRIDLHVDTSRKFYTDFTRQNRSFLTHDRSSAPGPLIDDLYADYEQYLETYQPLTVNTDLPIIAKRNRDTTHTRVQ